MPTEPRHILIVHVAGLAETTLALPALRALRQHLPQSRITVVSSPAGADLLRLAACVDEILPVARFRNAELLDPRKFYRAAKSLRGRSEEHTSELQSLRHLVCRLLLEKKKNKTDMLTNRPP